MMHAPDGVAISFCCPCRCRLACPRLLPHHLATLDDLGPFSALCDRLQVVLSGKQAFAPSADAEDDPDRLEARCLSSVTGPPSVLSGHSALGPLRRRLGSRCCGGDGMLGHAVASAVPQRGLAAPSSSCLRLFLSHLPISRAPTTILSPEPPVLRRRGSTSTIR